MQIDWFTVSAQVINFLILVWALNRFLMKPVLQAVDAREKLIAGKLEAAERANADAAKLQGEYTRKNAEWESKKSTLMEAATRDATQLRQKLLADVRSEMDAWRENRLRQLDSDMQAANQQMTERLGSAVQEIIDKAIRQLTGSNVEELIIREFMDHLQKWNRSELLAMLPETNATLTLVTAFPVREELQETIRSQIPAIFARACNLVFETDASVMSGAELRFPGRSIEWSFREYLRQSAEAALHSQNNHHP